MSIGDEQSVFMLDFILKLSILMNGSRFQCSDSPLSYDGGLIFQSTDRGYACPQQCSRRCQLGNLLGGSSLHWSRKECLDVLDDTDSREGGNV